MNFKKIIKTGLIISGIALGATLFTAQIYYSYLERKPKQIQIENKYNLFNEEIKEAKEEIIIYEKKSSYSPDKEVLKNILEANERGVDIKYFIDDFIFLDPETKKELTDLVENKIIRLFKYQKPLEYNSVLKGADEKLFSTYDMLIRDGAEIYFLGPNNFNLRVPFNQFQGSLLTRALMKRTEPFNLN